MEIDKNNGHRQGDQTRIKLDNPLDAWPRYPFLPKRGPLGRTPLPNRQA